jgi:multidrug efflux pump subunit AcrB
MIGFVVLMGLVTKNLILHVDVFQSRRTQRQDVALASFEADCDDNASR